MGPQSAQPKTYLESHIKNTKKTFVLKQYKFYNVLASLMLMLFKGSQYTLIVSIANFGVRIYKKQDRNDWYEYRAEFRYV